MKAIKTALWLSLALSGLNVRAEEPLARSVEAVEGFLSGMDASVLTGAGAPRLELPPPAPSFNDAELDLVGQEVIRGALELSSQMGLGGHDYFLKHPDSPKIKAFFKNPSRKYEPSLREMLPIRYWMGSKQGKTGDNVSVLHTLAIPVDGSFYNRVSDEIPQAYPRGYFKSIEDRVRRASLFLIPRALADLEIARIMDQEEVPNYVRVDAAEELRILYELAALRALIAGRENLLADPSSRLIPAELEYLKGLGLWSLLRPSEKAFSSLAEERLGEGRWNVSKWTAVIRIQAKDGSKDALLERNRKATSDAFKAISADARRMGHEPGSQAYEQLSVFEAAIVYLGHSGALASLKETLDLERSRAFSLYKSPLRLGSENAFSLQANLAMAWASAEQMDFRGMKRSLRNAGERAAVLGVTVDVKGLSQELELKFKTPAHARKTLLSHPEAEARENAAAELGEMGEKAKETLSALARALASDREPRVRAAAAAALGKQGREAISPLESAGKRTGEEEVVLMDVVASLGEIGLEAVPALARFLDYRSWDFRESISQTIAKMGDKAIPAMMAELKKGPQSGDNFDIRSGWIFYSLALMGPASVPTLLKSLDDPNKRIRICGVRALGQVGPPAKDAVEPLGKIALKERGSEIRDDAALSLIRIGAAAIPVWVEALKQDDPRLREYTFLAIARLGPEAESLAPHLIAYIEKNGSEDYPINAAQTLGSIGPPAIPTCLKALKSDKKKVRLGAIRALQDMGPAAKEALEALREVSREDPLLDVRNRADWAVKAIVNQ